MSPLKIFQASYNDNKQGIVAVLSSDSDRSKIIQPSSLPRNLSADMSSHKWISHLKKVASSQEFRKSKTEDETETDDSVWSSIIKRDDSTKVIADPYVHPLVKKSLRCLSEKSLEICTESLGSETGSDGFSSYPSSENGDTDDDDKEEDVYDEETRTFELEDQWMPVKYSYKKLPPHRSFPPPLPSLSGPDGESLRMQPRRDNGRLVLEAMSVPSQNNFRAQRQDGRLVLTLVNPHPMEQVEEEDDHFEGEQEEEEDPKREKSSELPSRLLNAHRLASMMNSKSIVLANRHPSLPPRPKAAQPIIACAPTPAAATVSLNAYEYYWRPKSMAKVGVAANPLGQQSSSSFKNSSRKVMICKNRTANEEQRLVVMSSNGSCKEVRRTVVFWEPRCIATS